MPPRESHEDTARSIAPTLASNLYERIRGDLLAGRLEPGRRLQIEHLAEPYKAGQTPLREALNRLTADGLVDRKDQRGFAVAAVSADDLREICEQLGDQLYRYRQLAVHRTFPRRHHREEHAAMLQAVLDNDVDGAIALLKKHYTQTAEIILGDEQRFG